MLGVEVFLYMIGLTATLVAGMLLGLFLRDKKHVNLNRITFAVIIMLIFSLGFSIGSSNELLDSLPRVGLSAIVITLLAIGFSVLFVKAAEKAVHPT